MHRGGKSAVLIYGGKRFSANLFSYSPKYDKIYGKIWVKKSLYFF